jgi:hypothetical protein
MKILLLGEFSGLHKNLKEGLQELGHEVVIASGGDGWKKISSDISFNSKLPSVLGKVHAKLMPLLDLKKLSGFDVVQVITPFFLSLHPSIDKWFFSQLKNRNGKLFFVAAGGDAFYWNNARQKLKYHPLDDSLKYDFKKTGIYLETAKAFKLNQELVELADGVIPCMYEYSVCYEGISNLMDVVPLPMNVNKIKFQPNIVGQKMVVLHGLNRYGFKGTHYVEKAFKVLDEKYPNQMELIIEGNLPLNEYLLLMEKTNIVIDQVSSYSCGMNAIYAMAMGKVVIGGAEPESLKALNVEESPVINVSPSVASIVEKVEGLLLEKDSIAIIGSDSRVFSEKVHGHIHIATQYLKQWTKC